MWMGKSHKAPSLDEELQEIKDIVLREGELVLLRDELPNYLLILRIYTCK